LRIRSLLLKVLYWLAVLLVSLVLLVLLVLFFESRDSSQVGNGESGAGISDSSTG
jgi:hypothetical protein